jgi:lipopolysaccharide/colanic/teichoic acid biosynthesis glycosyltransferase
MSIITDPQHLVALERGRESRSVARQDIGLVPAPYFAWKSLPGRALALAMLIVLLPPMAVLVVIVRLSSQGPAIFKQTRVGLHGRAFTMYKLRTMRLDAEAGTGPTWSTPNDPRVTRLGRLIRRLHLDELPQLFNVVAGQMALVGPRPERPEFTQLLARKVPGYLDRLHVKPGITGLAQINLPPDTDLESVRRKLVLDREYVATANLFLDARIILCTSLRAVAIHGTVTRRFLGLDRWEAVKAATSVKCANEPESSDDVSHNGASDETAPPMIPPRHHARGRQAAHVPLGSAPHRNLPR